MTTQLAGPATDTTPADDVRSGAAALLAGALSAAIGVTQLLFPQDQTAEIDPRTRVLLAGMSVMLWALALVYLGLRGRSRSSWPGVVAAAGAAGLTIGTLSSAINGEDLAFFPVVAAVANAAWLIGSIALSVSLWRAGRVPRPLAAVLWLVMPLSLFGSQLGGGVPAGAILLGLGALLLRNSMDRRR